MYKLAKIALSAGILACLALPAWASPYSVTWSTNGTPATTEINPLKKPLSTGPGFFDETGFYGEGNPVVPITRPEALTFYLYENGNDQLSVSMILTPGSRINENFAVVDIFSTGLGGQGVTTLLQDDPSDFPAPWNETAGSTTAFFSSRLGDTDGMILGYLPSAAGSSWSLTFDLLLTGGYSSLDIWYLQDPFVTEQDAVYQVTGNQLGTINSVTFSRTAEAVAMPGPATALFPLAILGLLVARRAKRSQR